jgi:nicotinamide-nucleotide amidase
LWATIVRRLVAAAQHGLFRSDILIFSGGLGPTEDDLTREAVAEALGLTLRRDPEILARLEQRFAEPRLENVREQHQAGGCSRRRHRPSNPNGTAPGQWLSGEFDGREHIIVLLPGPPHELKALFEAEVRERLRAKVPPAFLAVRTLKIAMLGESAVDARVAPIYKRYADVETTILAGAGEIELHFKTRAATQDAAQSRVDEVAGVVEDELDDAVYSRNGESLEQIVGYWLQMRTATVAVAESCTGGLLAERITSISGSSRYFLGGAVVYSNALKTELAGVPAEMIDRHGAVSREVAAALAEGIRYRCESTLGYRHHRRGRTERRHSGEARGTGVPRRSQQHGNRSSAAQFSRRPQTHPPLRCDHGAGYAAEAVDVKRGSQLLALGSWLLALGS